MNPIDIINKYYPEENELRHILLTHSRSVADKSLWIADRHPELSLDKDFLSDNTTSTMNIFHMVFLGARRNFA